MVLHKWNCNRRISSPYLTPVKLPAITIKTITEPSPNLSLKNASVGEAFPTTSIYTTSTARTEISEPRLICEKDPSPLPHRKLSRTMCRQPSHATCTSERKTNARSTSSQTKLAQSVSHSFWVNVAIMIAYRS